MVYYKKFLLHENAFLVRGSGGNLHIYLTSMSITTEENPYGKGDTG